MTFETPVGTDYVVPDNTTFYITEIHMAGDTIGSGITLGYGDDGVADGAEAPTNWIALTSRLGVAAADAGVSISIFLIIPAGKYPCGKSFYNTNNCTIFGIEVPD